MKEKNKKNNKYLKEIKTKQKTNNYVAEKREKLNIIEKEYDIPLEEDLRKDVSVMCNLSQGIVDDTKAEIILNMLFSVTSAI